MLLRNLNMFFCNITILFDSYCNKDYIKIIINYKEVE